jgi:hypothetical protein
MVWIAPWWLEDTGEGAKKKKKTNKPNQTKPNNITCSLVSPKKW